MLGYKSSEVSKPQRYYLRFHQTIKRALDFNRELYGDQKGKDGKQFKYQHPIRVAGMTEQIAQQGIYEYHLNWLVGVLHDAKEDDPVFFSEKIDEVLKDLLQKQKQQIFAYIDQLSKDKTLPKGEQKRQHVHRMRNLDIVPSYIKIFDKYDNCRRFLNNSVGKSASELNGYFAVAVICYDIAIQTHGQIKTNLSREIKNFFQGLRQRLGGTMKCREFAEKYYKI